MEEAIEPARDQLGSRERPVRRRLASAAVPAADDEVALLNAVVATQAAIAAADLDPQQVMDVAAERARELAGADGAALELLEGHEIVAWAASGSLAGHVGLRLDAGSSLSGACVRGGEAIRCHDVEADARADRAVARRLGIRSILVVPLRHRDETVGVLKVASSRPGSFSDGDVRALGMVAAFVGASLSHANAFSGAIELLGADPLSLDGASSRPERWSSRVGAVLESRALDVVFQPIVDLEHRRVVGVEALSRFPSEAGVPPDRWFAIAAALGCGVELEMLAVERALAALARVPEELYVSVNVSPAAACSRRLRELTSDGVAARVVVEVTEHARVRDYDALSRALVDVRENGCRLAIDDAGAGFASLRHVLQLAPDIIKLDISLTRGVDVDRQRRRLAAALVAFAREAGSAIVAEGVETRSELDALRDLGVGYAQGFYFGRPGPLESAFTVRA